MTECRELPSDVAQFFVSLPEMYLGLGVERDQSTGIAHGPARLATGQRIDTSIAFNPEAVTCLEDIIQSNPSLASYSSRTIEIIRHFRNIDGFDPNHVTWEELTREYGSDASSVAYSLNAYIGLLTFLTSSGPIPSFSAGAAQESTAPSTPPKAVASYGNLVQAYVGLGVGRDSATGISRCPTPAIPQEGLNLDALIHPADVARLEETFRDNPELLADLRRVQQILVGLSQADPARPGILTADEILLQYGESAGLVLVSINAYLGLLGHVGARCSVPTPPQDSDFNPWVVGGLTAWAAIMIGTTSYLLLRSESAPPSPPGENIALPAGPDGRWTLGRQANADLVPHPAISARHAEIQRTTDGTYTIRDLRSTNGTYIRRHQAAGGGGEWIRIENSPVPLRERDVVLLGNIAFQISLGRNAPTLRRYLDPGLSLPQRPGNPGRLPPPPLPELFVPHEGRSIVNLSIAEDSPRHENLFFVARHGYRDGTPSESLPPQSRYTSQPHMAIRWDRSTGDLLLRDSGSLNGTEVFRVDPATASCRRIPIGSDAEVQLQEGDVIRFGRSYVHLVSGIDGPHLVEVVRSQVPFPAALRAGLTGLPTADSPVDRWADSGSLNIPAEFYLNDDSLRDLTRRMALETVGTEAETLRTPVEQPPVAPSFDDHIIQMRVMAEIPWELNTATSRVVARVSDAVFQTLSRLSPRDLRRYFGAEMDSEAVRGGSAPLSFIRAHVLAALEPSMSRLDPERNLYEDYIRQMRRDCPEGIENFERVLRDARRMAERR